MLRKVVLCSNPLKGIFGKGVWRDQSGINSIRTVQIGQRLEVGHLAVYVYPRHYVQLSKTL